MDSVHVLLAAAVIACVVPLALLTLVLVRGNRRAAEGEVRRLEVERREGALGEREARLQADQRAHDERTAELQDQESELRRQQQVIEGAAKERDLILAEAARMSPEDARAELIRGLEQDAKLAAAGTVREIEQRAAAEAEERARLVLTTAIQRLAAPHTADAVTSLVAISGDDTKGRIIGREGRNIRHFEHITGVNVIVDDTPDSVALSCFDPVRREVARVALEHLVADGRIYPSRIEEACASATDEIDRRCLRAGEDALVEVGVTDLAPDLVALLGQLRYRTSYGQNVLEHLLETAHLARMMAEEIGLDPAVSMRGALLHDLGKALTHEAEGSHALVGADLARRHGESADVVHAIEAHHNEVEPRTVEAILVQAADAISGSRPGARRDTLDGYVQRLAHLEQLAGAHAGVDRVYAMQSGHELRVMVLPDKVDDIAAQVLARDIAKDIEHQLTYPGQIRVTVVRESRSTEIAR